MALTFLSRPVCLPVLARLWRPRHTGKIAHARELAELIAARLRKPSSSPTPQPLGEERKAVEQGPKPKELEHTESEERGQLLEEGGPAEASAPTGGQS